MLGAEHGGVEAAIAALLGLQNPGLPVFLADPSTVRFEVCSIGSRDGVVFDPYSVQVELIVDVQLKPEKNTYRFRSKMAESIGMSDGVSVYYGYVRLKLRNRYLTLDGVNTLEFDSVPLFERIDSVLEEVGWHRRKNFFERWLSRDRAKK